MSHLTLATPLSWRVAQRLAEGCRSLIGINDLATHRCDIIATQGNKHHVVGIVFPATEYDYATRVYDTLTN